MREEGSKEGAKFGWNLDEWVFLERIRIIGNLGMEEWYMTHKWDDIMSWSRKVWNMSSFSDEYIEKREEYALLNTFSKYKNLMHVWWHKSYHKHEVVKKHIAAAFVLKSKI